MNEWTPAEQQQHRQDLDDALDGIAWDPDWPAQAVVLVPEEPAPRLRIGYGWSSLVYT
jgi:hypothetical protein